MLKYLFLPIFLLFQFFICAILPQTLFAQALKQTEDVILSDTIIINTEDGNKKKEITKKSIKRLIKDEAEQDEIVVTNKPVKQLSQNDNKSNNEKYNLALKYLNEGKKFEARKLLSEIYLNDFSKNNSQIKEKLDLINRKLVFSTEPSPDSFIYTVKGGDTLGKIAKNNDTTYQLIMLINGKPRTNIRIGERLKIIKGTFNIFVDKSEYILILTLNDHYIKQYDIGTGKDDKTPVGTFEVSEKMVEPTWYAGNGEVYKFGHEKNVLGTRWIGFKDKPGYYGFGIHGTAYPESIGKSESNGCVRLKNQEVEELYVFVTSESKVFIQN